MSETDFASYVDDNAHYISRDSKNTTIKSLEDDSVNLFGWFLATKWKQIVINVTFSLVKKVVWI